jgi:hypothetical protein
MSSQAMPPGRPVVIRPEMLGRLLIYVSFIPMVGIAFGGLAAAISGSGWDHLTGAVFVVVGLGCAVLCWFSIRTGIRCDHGGIRIRGFKTTFIPAGEIDHLIVANVRVVYGRGGPGISPAVVAVRKDGSEVPLGPTLRTPFNQPKTEAKLCAMAEQIQAALGLKAGGTIPVMRNIPPPIPPRKRAGHTPG